MESLRTLHKAHFTDVLDYGIHLYKKHFRKIFLLTVLFNIPLMVLITFIYPMFTDQYMNFLNPTANISPEPGAILSSMLTLYTLLFGYLAVYAVQALTLQNVLDGSIVKILYADVVLDQKRTVKQVVRECFKQFGSLFLGKLLYILIQSAVIFVLYIVVIVAVFAGTFAVMGVVTSTFIAPWVTVVLTILGILVCLAIVLLIAVVVGFFNGRYWMFLPAVCIEQLKAGSSIGRCGNLGKNNFYLIGLSYVVGYILVAMFPGIFNTVFSYIGAVTGNLDTGLLQVGTVIAQIFSTLLQPVLTCILTALYITLRVKREGLDMEITLWSIKKEEADRAQRWMVEAPDAAK